MKTQGKHSNTYKVKVEIIYMAIVNFSITSKLYSCQTFIAVKWTRMCYGHVLYINFVIFIIPHTEFVKLAWSCLSNGKWKHSHM